MKRRTTRQVVKGHVRQLRADGIEIKRNGHAYRNGKPIKRATLERHVRRLREEPKPAPKKRPPREKKLIFQRGPQAVETPERQRERRMLQAILGRRPTEAQLDRAMERVLEERRAKMKKATKPKITWEMVDRWLIQQPKHELVPTTARERAEMVRVYSLDFYAVMRILDERGVLDHARFQEVSKRFGVPIHDVYGVFFGYPPTVGSRAA